MRLIFAVAVLRIFDRMIGILLLLLVCALLLLVIGALLLGITVVIVLHFCSPFLIVISMNDTVSMSDTAELMRRRIFQDAKNYRYR